MEDEEFIFNNYLYEDDELNLKDTFLEDEEFFLKPSNIIMDDDELNEYLPLQEENNKDSHEIKIIKYNRKELNEDELFTSPRLFYGDKELDNLDENEEDENDLFKPIELIYEDDHLELFNKRREQGIIINSSKKRIDDNPIDNRVKTKPKSFLSTLKEEIKAKVLDKE